MRTKLRNIAEFFCMHPTMQTPLVNLISVFSWMWGLECSVALRGAAFRAGFELY